jgi:hypothetical protein
MKTEVLVPDEVFLAAERFAQERGLSRNDVFTQALEAFLERQGVDPLTEAINQVADRVDTGLDPELERLQTSTLERHS